MSDAKKASHDADALVAKYGVGKRPGVPCSGATAKPELVAALHEKGVQWQRICEILNAEFGINASPKILSYHYHGRCHCPR